MNIIQWFARLLPGSETIPQTHEPPIPENLSLVPAEPPSKPESSAFADDASPPGHKIRWHC